MGGVALGGYPWIDSCKGSYGYATLPGMQPSPPHGLFYTELHHLKSLGIQSPSENGNGTPTLRFVSVIGHPNDPLTRWAGMPFSGMGFFGWKQLPYLSDAGATSITLGKASKSQPEPSKVPRVVAGGCLSGWELGSNETETKGLRFEKMIIFEKIYMGVSKNRGTPNHLF